MAKVEATADSRISDIASEPRAAAKPRSPQKATICTNGTAMAGQQQKPAAERSAMSANDGMGRADRSSGAPLPARRRIGEGRPSKAHRNSEVPATTPEST